MPQTPNPQPLEEMSLGRKIEAMQWATRFPALTLMVVLRRDIGYRTLNPLWLGGVVVFMVLMAGIANDSRRPDDLLIFSLVVLTLGFHQKYLRWLEIHQGTGKHSYYIGTSIFERLRWPGVLHRQRRISRFMDPLFAATVGILLLRYTPLLALWVIFAAICLSVFESVVYRREFNRTLDTVDGLVDSQIQEVIVEHFEPSPDTQVKPSRGIPTGLGDDIRAHVQNRKPPA